MIWIDGDMAVEGGTLAEPKLEHGEGLERRIWHTRHAFLAVASPLAHLEGRGRNNLRQISFLHLEVSVPQIPSSSKEVWWRVRESRR